MCSMILHTEAWTLKWNVEGFRLTFPVAASEATLLMTGSACVVFPRRTSVPNNNWIVLPIAAFPCVLIGIPACQTNLPWSTER